MTDAAELDALIVAYLSGDLEAEALAALEPRLVDDAAAARRMAWWCRQDLDLRKLSPVPVAAATEPKAQPPAPRTHHPVPRSRPRAGVSRAPWGLAAAAVLMLAGAAWWAMRPAPAPEAQPVAAAAAMATVRSTNGTCWLHRGDDNLALTAGQAIRPGDGIACPVGTATILYADGTSLELQSGCDVALGEDAGGKQVRLERGALVAEVAAQAKGAAMRFRTVQSEALVLGTRLSLATAAEATWLEVTKGRVQLTRSSDGAAIEVAAGNLAVAGVGIDLVARPIAGGAENLALGRPATASTSFEGADGARNPPNLGNDGDTATGWSSRDSHVAPDLHAWWQVDLGIPCRIQRVELVTRQDQFNQVAARANFEVRGSDHADGSDATILARYQDQPLPQHATWTGNVSDQKAYRFIRVVQLKAEYFGFAELRLFGKPWNGLAVPASTK